VSAPRLVLASGSPRRRQLLEMLGLEVEVRPPHIPEIRAQDEAPRSYVERLAREKAASVAGDLVLGADTTVVIEGEVLEKPADADDALRMLRRLQGRTHDVITAIALKTPAGMLSAIDVTAVAFRRADDDFLRAYVATGEPMDKAGAYGIQGYGAALVERIEGDFFSVMGLPVRRVLALMEQAGHPYRFGRERAGPIATRYSRLLPSAPARSRPNRYGCPACSISASTRRTGSPITLKKSPSIRSTSAAPYP
jgi:septum formation protein